MDCKEAPVAPPSVPYRGRIAPTPTGFLHLGHAATFGAAHARARAAGGEIVLRLEDIDPRRCLPLYAEAAMEDLRWLGLHWDGEPLWQSRRRERYLAAWRQLRDGGWIYPCTRSRKEVAEAAPLTVGAFDQEEPLFPAAWRTPVEAARAWETPAGVNWRFRVPDGEIVAFDDGLLGALSPRAGTDFGDFLVWNRDDVPAYELAVVVDDAGDGITEVVRGADLLLSTSRQLLLYRALGLGGAIPAFRHTPLIRDASGRRLAKRDAALALRAMREAGATPETIWEQIDRNGPLPGQTP
ncbi:glutamyl-tRNA synthetase [Verrucomicrobium sp. GAS474]|uniref:glutamate--tRNA ligase family protein n=1 Tax=Verrucomicrobium sp. GAS474 TaxID=1882831 RepID=UPI00087C5804|nr:glutamate--tRNA ligase family protein [Verrucomicrobium sp. GAS474]SDU04187.1 glutamyl-tRNA synthetase [Verrucomicrobium sp. GAS474]